MAKGKRAVEEMKMGSPALAAKRESRRKCVSNKENFCVYEDVGLAASATKSPLPKGFPRIPLQDITAILSLPLQECRKEAISKCKQPQILPRNAKCKAKEGASSSPLAKVKAKAKSKAEEDKAILKGEEVSLEGVVKEEGKRKKPKIEENVVVGLSNNNNAREGSALNLRKRPLQQSCPLPASQRRTNSILKFR